jgi:hypothetical protein
VQQNDANFGIGTLAGPGLFAASFCCVDSSGTALSG